MPTKIIAGILMAGPCVLHPATSTGQWQIPVPIVMNAQDPTGRQVTGLGDPITHDAAVSYDALLSNATTYAYTTGSTVLTGTLTPSITTYTPGMIVTIRPMDPNAASAMLDLNGLGPLPIQKWGGVPVDSADLAIDVPVRLIHTGNVFLLLSNTYIPCPAGYTLIDRSYCIADSAFATPLSFLDAVSACAVRGARLCTIGEWSHACTTVPGFLSTVTALEWVDHASNGAEDSKSVGTGRTANNVVTTEMGCTYGSTSLHTSLLRHRCCVTR